MAKKNNITKKFNRSGPKKVKRAAKKKRAVKKQKAVGKGKEARRASKAKKRRALPGTQAEVVRSPLVEDNSMGLDDVSDDPVAEDTMDLGSDEDTDSEADDEDYGI